MHKCGKCGTEFEGKFCPHCGTEYVEQKICKKCGAVVTDRFCSVCGTEYVTSQKVCWNCGAKYTGYYCPKCGAHDLTASEKVGRSDATHKKYWTLTRLPLILFLSLFVFLLIFYFCRYTTYSYTYGSGRNVRTSSYDISIFDGYDGASVWLIVYFAIYFVVSLTLFIVGFVSGAKKREKYNRFQMYGIVGCIFMAVSFINGIIVCSTASSGENYEGVGAGPVLILVFSLLFFIVSAFCVVQSVRLVKIKSDYAEAERADEDKYQKRLTSSENGVQAQGSSSCNQSVNTDRNGARTAIKVLAILEIIFGCIYIFPIIFGGIILSQMRYRKPATGICVCNIIFGNIFGIACAIVALCSPSELFVSHSGTISAQNTSDEPQRGNDQSPFSDFVQTSGFDDDWENAGNLSRYGDDDSQGSVSDVTLSGEDKDT